MNRPNMLHTENLAYERLFAFHSIPKCNKNCECRSIEAEMYFPETTAYSEFCRTANAKVTSLKHRNFPDFPIDAENSQPN